MWQVNNKTPFAVLGYFVRDRAGAEHWITAVRARFHILSNTLNRLVDDQGQIRIKPEYVDDEGHELLAEADVCPFRPRTDFLLTGNVRIPQGRAVNKTEAGFDLAGRSKRATVFGSRKLRKTGGKIRLEGYEPFGGCRLSWRNSLGGTDFVDAEGPAHPDNPIGMGWSTHWENMPDGTEVSLPYVENPDAYIGEGPLPATIGYGAIQPAWRARASLAGTYDDDWRKNQAPLPPEDFLDSFHQAAPKDQVFDLKGGETGSIVGMSEDGDYDFRLPQLILNCSAWISRQKIEKRPRLISVLVNGSEKTVEMVWNAVFPCPGGDMTVSGSSIYIRQMAGVER